MSHPLRSSFHRKLTAAFLAVGVLPLLICVVLMLNVFQLFLARSTEDTAAAQLSAVTEDMGKLLSSCEDVLEQLGRHGRILQALDGAGQDSQSVYSALYAVASPLLREADFSLYDAQGHLLYTTAAASARADLSTAWGLLAAAGASPGVVYRDVPSFSGTASACMQAARAVRDRGKLSGYAVASLNTGHFRRLLEGKYGAGSDILILDPFWDEVYTSPTLQDKTLAPALRERLLSGQALAAGGENQLYHVAREEVSGFYVILRQPKPVADWVMRLLYLITALSILLCLGLCLAVSMAFSRQLFRPIRSLNSAMAAVEGGDLDVRVEVPGTDEMSQLAGRFNRMTERLKTNLTDSIRQQQELGNAQIRMMQAQLNPHFLYNTLDTLKWMGKIHHVPEVATISADLADILRRSISADEFVRLEDELRLLERYVEIQKIRFAGKFEFRAAMDEDLLDIPVPKLMLQPLVENAIIHGFEDGMPGEITVTAARAGDDLLLTVQDNGCGMSPESLRRFQEQTPPAGRHLGLHNVDAILRLNYGQERGLKFLPPPGGRGTCIRISIPITRQGGRES